MSTEPNLGFHDLYSICELLVYADDDPEGKRLFIVYSGIVTNLSRFCSESEI